MVIQDNIFICMNFVKLEWVRYFMGERGEWGTGILDENCNGNGWDHARNAFGGLQEEHIA